MSMAPVASGVRLGPAVPSLLAALLPGAAALGVWAGGGPPAAGLAALALVGALCAGMLWHAGRRRRADADALARTLAALASGDTRARLPVGRLGDLAGAAAAANGLGETLQDVARRIALHVGPVDRLPDDLAGVLSELRHGGEEQEAAVEETASLLANINASIRHINEQVDRLSRTNDEASSSILEMGTAADQLARSAASLHESVESSTNSVHEMGANARQVAESAENVRSMAEETASSMVEMDRAIQQVGEHVRGASVLTEEVSRAAEEGSLAVQDTVQGIAEIRKVSSQATEVLERLAGRIAEIGDIVTVIGSINDETNLLSLNAAIIAAQAGEHGKAFGVVADQVKTLAQRTARSTQEIVKLIEAVQEESGNARSAMAEGMETVEAGVARSRRAGEMLETIRRSAREASGRVAEIARATDEQGHNSRHVAEAAQRTSSHVHEISEAMSEHTRASERLLDHANGALDLCRQMHSATEQQRATGQYMTENIAAVTEMIGTIQESTSQHERASRAVAEIVARILESAHKSGDRLPRLGSAFADLREHARALREEVAAFDPEAEREPRAGSDQPPVSRPSSATQTPA